MKEKRWSVPLVIGIIVIILSVAYLSHYAPTGKVIDGSGSVQSSGEIEEKYTICSDSDGGDNIFQSGIIFLDGEPLEVHFKTGEPLSSDNCYTSRRDGKPTAVEKFCIKNEDDTFSVGEIERECPQEYICASGSCAQKIPGKKSCEDSDGGKNAMQRGILLNYGNPEKGYEDFCDGPSAVYENFCEEDDKGELLESLERIACPQGTLCDEGACVVKEDENKQSSGLCKPDCVTCVNPSKRHNLGQACWKGECISRSSIPTVCEDDTNPCREGTRDQITCNCKMRNKPDGTACGKGICSQGSCVAEATSSGGTSLPSLKRITCTSRLNRIFGLC